MFSCTKSNFYNFLTQRDEEENNLLDQKSLEIQKKKSGLLKLSKGENDLPRVFLIQGFEFGIDWEAIYLLLGDTANHCWQPL